MSVSYRRTSIVLAVLATLFSSVARAEEPRGDREKRTSVANAPVSVSTSEPTPNPGSPGDLAKSVADSRPAPRSGVPTVPFSAIPPAEVSRTVQSVLWFAAASFAPIALLMFTAFIRINIVLQLLRQALGSPQIPGNQVLSALALLLTFLVMRPTAERVYVVCLEPYSKGEITISQAWEAGSTPLKKFMVDQIVRANRGHYLAELYDYAEPPSPGRLEPTYADEYPMSVVAPAFLLSEITTALMIGFLIYLPFLVIDLVVSAVLAATGLFMLPPALVASPLKLVLFVLADGWLLTATSLLRTFSPIGP